MLKIWTGGVAAVVLAAVPCAHAQDAVQWRVEDGGNGHWYSLVHLDTPMLLGPLTSSVSEIGATVAALDSAGERLAVLGLLEESIASIPNGQSVVLDGMGWSGCRKCPAYWRGGEPISEGWAAGQPDQTGNFAVALDPSTSSLSAWQVEAAHLWTILEWSADCNGNGLIDYSELISGDLGDDNENWIPDVCEAIDSKNLVENGSFESNPVNQCCTSASGWSGGIDLVWIEWFSDTGGISIDLNTGSASSISQSIEIENGGDFLLEFAMAGNDCGTSPAMKAMRVSVGSFSEDFFHEIPSVNELSQRWSLFHRLVRLDAGLHTLRFQSLVGGCGGPAVDSISLRPFEDCNGDGIDDSLQVLDGSNSDENENGIPDCCEPIYCRGDLNGDDSVGPPDLGILLAVWGTDGGKISGADINEDGTVNAADLGLLVGAWGDCGCD
jgi:hypothetical protein